MITGKTARLWLCLCVGLAALAFVISSCTSSTEPDPKTPPENLAPKVQIVNIPPDSSHFTNNPVLYWFGRDVDGYIIAYEYAVVPAARVNCCVDPSKPDSIVAWVGRTIKTAKEMGNCVPESCWQYLDVKETDSPNSQTIRLFADKDPEINVDQYFFVRAVDNDSARSNIDFRLYSRNNHPPDTEIKTLPDTLGYYDLPETTLTYRGILFEWKGTDEIDYPPDKNIEPQFDYFYQVFGPYYDISEIPFDSAGAVDAARFDTTTAKLVMESKDTATGLGWVKPASVKLYNLWREEYPGFSRPDRTLSAYFVLKVTSRDDSFVADTLPAYVAFNAIYPVREKDVLVYVAPFCSLVDSPGDTRCVDTLYADTSTIFPFYREAFRAAGYEIPPLLVASVSHDNIPDRFTLAQYKLFVMLTDGQKAYLKEKHFESVAPYMDFGGNVWIWGTAPFGYSYSGGKGLKSVIPAKGIPYAYLYFNVIGEFRDGWRDSYLARYFKICPPYPPTNEEFVGGTALASSGMPSFEIDQSKVARTYFVFSDTIGYRRCCLEYDGIPVPEQCNPKDTIWEGTCIKFDPVAICDTIIYEQKIIRWVAAPHTNYFVRDIYAEPLWLYESYYGDFVPDSLREIVSGLQGKVIGVRFNAGTFKSAVYGFSMWMLKPNDAAEIVSRTLSWFLE